ncbi:MAG: lamin tail domain-containing protein [Akkermansiaceae bacterium]
MRFLFPLFLLFPPLLSGEIVINEISATRADRLLRWDVNDQPFAGSAPAWWSSSFNDNLWKTGNMPIGYGTTVTTNLGSKLRDVSPSLYVRKTFTASSSDAASGSALNLEIKYNDGFVAWINGIEVARENMGAPKAHIFHDQVSYRASAQTTAAKTIDLGIASSLLVDGENVIAVQINNNLINGNMLLDMALKIDASTVFFNMGSSVEYLPGLNEASSDVVEPADPDLNSSDWIELHNNGDSTVSIAGWTLTDDEQRPSRWTFPAGTEIQANGYLLVLADDPDDPIPGAHFLHTNFKLGSDGEFVGLYDTSGAEISSFSPSYPKQLPNFSYGLNAAGKGVYFATPSPGKANSGTELDGKVDAPDFDHKGGFYDNAITLTLTSMTPGAAIRYTTDGTEPTASSGVEYTAPLSLARVSGTRGHVIRARAFLAGSIPSNVKTHTFLIEQEESFRNAPALIYAGDEQRSLYDPFGALAIGGGTYSNNQWRPSGIGDYNNTVNRGRPYERPIHAEFYFPDGTVGFRSNVGLRVSASSWSRPRLRLTGLASSPWQNNGTQKPSFNLYFRDEYGNPEVNLPLNGLAHEVEDYSQFRVRAGKNDITNPFIVDELVRRLSREMGNPGSIGVINSLYVNGVMKGYYNMVERVREPFLSELHGTPPGVGWDILAFENGTDNVADGDKSAWNDMINRLNASPTEANWNRVLEIADIINMADYYLLNIYTATWDWPHNNWIAAKERSDRGRYRLYVWDAEGAMNNAGNRAISTEMINQFIRTGSGELRDLWRGLTRWEQFRILFADRIHKHMFNGGVLDDRDQENSIILQRLDQIVDEAEDLIKRVHNQGAVNVSKINSWVREGTGRRRYLFGPTRESFRNQNLWPTTQAPDFSKLGGSLAFGETLKITAAEGEIYYTTDGSDPRLFDGNANPAAISQPGSLVDIPLIALESTWFHNATDGDLGVTWKSPSFDHSGWLSGPGPLGYGNINDAGTPIPIATTVNSPFPRQPTSYFRRTFGVADASKIIELKLQVRSDAGTVIHINGVEAFHDTNIPQNASYGTLPTSDSSDGNEGDLDTYIIDASMLVSGTNTIAVELHNNPGSSDMVFDLQLDASSTNDDNLPVVIHGPTTVKARTLADGIWSPLTEASFTVETVPAASSNLAVVEMLYNPAGASTDEMNAGFDDGDMFEFLRIQNTGSDSIDLSEVRFVAGIDFLFADADIQVLAPNGVALIVANRDAFRARYGTIYNHLIAGEYTGQLSNGGENVRIIGDGDTVLHEFIYDNSTPWPDLSALDGHSITLLDAKGDHDEGANWAASNMLGGTPDGRLTFDMWKALTFSTTDQNNAAVSGSHADPDGDGWNNLFEFALNSAPQNQASTPRPITSSIEQIGDERYLVLSVTRANVGTTMFFSADTSDHLDTWTQGGGIRIAPDIFNPDGTITSRFRHPLPVTPADRKRFLRLRLTPIN